MTMRALQAVISLILYFISSSLAFGQDSVDAVVSKPKEDFLLNGICKYRCRQFSDAANDLGAALPSEFNNPLLHYYYANCMVHLRRKESAIREYRIAYALQPVGTIAEYSKQCLSKFGIDAEGRALHDSKPSGAKNKIVDPKIPEPPSITELAALKANPKDGSESAIEREKSVDNLRNLMQQKRRASGAPLPTAVGTNLYVRHYKETPAPQKPQAQQQSLSRNQSTVADVKQAESKKKFGLWWW